MSLKQWHFNILEKDSRGAESSMPIELISSLHVTFSLREL